MDHGFGGPYMSQKLSKEDQDRVNSCDHYSKTKQVMSNLEAYKGLGVGEVYFIKGKTYSGEYEYVTAGYSDEPAKYMVFHKDDIGFIFIKRIIASGNLGKEVQCLTTQFDSDKYILEPDPEYVNSILLENEDGYDPLAASKENSAKKNKARRRNKKLELNFDDAQSAYDYIKTLRKGDVIYDCETAYGSGAVAWTVENVVVRKTDTSAPQGYSARWNKVQGATREDQYHNQHGFAQSVLVTIKADDTNLPKSRKYITLEGTLTFFDFYNERYRKFYKSRPFTVDDV